MARSTARKRALNTLYEADEKSQDFLSLLDERIAHPGAQTPLPEYAIDIVKGVAEHRKEIDGLLNEHSTSWPVYRMAVVDRNILRIAVWEMLDNAEVPNKVAIDEALSLAKVLSESDSPAFIHGLLSAIDSDLQVREQEAQEVAARADSAERIADLVEREASGETGDIAEVDTVQAADGVQAASSSGDTTALESEENSLDSMTFEPLSALEAEAVHTQAQHDEQ
ncbi:N utilization substance protein B [Bombiscardovia apis]|uniref:Transcription antitermination protein NusB n=1 Tax=Bombiscardovia apis TaxID=2932182 RepID=A0ABN6SG06_9BIFI|nr:transcription antitermination factor NusB [Bombiscardovia apis]BDR54945.1 N utilization substance protein B [Bombiscardovia apis]